jgi:hypothetical protein
MLRCVNLKMILNTDNNDLFSLKLVIAQAARFWFLIEEIRLQSQVSSCAIHVERSGTEAGFAPCFFGFPLLIIIPPLLHTHALIRQHIITTSGFKLRVSSLLQHLAGCGVMQT